MKNFICLILGLSFFACHAQAHLANEFMDRYQIYQLSEDSEFFREIEDLTEDLLINTQFSQFCELMWSPAITYMMTGVSANRSVEIFNACAKYRGENRFQGTVPKIFKREFYVAYDSEGKSPIQSWTTFDNKTVIFVDENFSREKLRHVLAHELAISVDGKTNMVYSTYLLYQNKGYDVGRTRIIDIGNLSSEEKRIQKRFNIATHRQISFAFAALRATMAERLFIGGDQDKPFELRYHENCKQAFLSIYESLRRNPELTVQNENMGFMDMMASMVAKNAEDMGMDNAIAEVLDDKLKFKDGNQTVTFCTYMARPLFSPKSVYSLFAAGPRPKVTGGWSPEMRERLSRDPRNTKNIYDSIKRDVKTNKAVKLDKLRSQI
ncbi:hypothetical protein [Bdellovibrio sp. HCB2-146]|uniref:hypothetical protein n=1 Tax=Bdellovibrio sp. HCB2-146 TaxID=3394362 RepID=UPI0039BD0813